MMHALAELEMLLNRCMQNHKTLANHDLKIIIFVTVCHPILSYFEYSFSAVYVLCLAQLRLTLHFEAYPEFLIQL
jgi:hypothetical protein